MSNEGKENKGPWGSAGSPLSGIDDLLLKRLQQMSRYRKYDEGEAHDVARAAADAGRDYVGKTAPDADVLLITSVPFHTANPRIVGNAVVQRMDVSSQFAHSLKWDVIPRMAGQLTSGWWERVKLAWCIIWVKHEGVDV